MSSTPSIQAVLNQNSFDSAHQPVVTTVERPAGSPAGNTRNTSSTELDAAAVSLSPEALARVRAEALAAVQAVAEPPQLAAQDAALLSNLAQVQAAGIDTQHPIFTDRSSSLDAVGLASVALAGQSTPEKVMTLLGAFYAVMRAPLDQIEPKTPPTDPMVRQMKMARIRESLLPPFADIRARQLIDAYLNRYLAMNPEMAEEKPVDAAANTR